MSHDLIIKFDTESARYEFALWLCESGEQEYWQWMEAQIESQNRMKKYYPDVKEYDKKIDVVAKFDYHGPENEEYPEDDARRYGEFLCDNTIRAKLQR